MTTPDRSDIDKVFIDFIRRSTRLSCDCDGASIQPPSLSTFRAHVQKNPDKHPDLHGDAAISEAFERIKRNARTQNTTSNSLADGHGNTSTSGYGYARKNRKRAVQAAGDDAGGRGRQEATPESDKDDEHDIKKRRSPTSSIVQSHGQNQHQPQTQSPQQQRRRQHHQQQQQQTQTQTQSQHTLGRGRGKQAENKAELDRGPGTSSSRKLWSPDDEPPPRTPQPSRTSQATPFSSARRSSHHRLNRPPPATQNSPPDDQAEDASVTRMIAQPETRPISQEQLVAEVKGIYAGLVMVESKCIEVDNAQSSNKDSLRQLSNEQWQALIALHRTLLHEHHDFFLASQHPSASPALRRLASKYAMPARMWRHGIHSFLELLRHKLPMSLEPMLTFIYIAYSMMALLYETVPAFEDTWVECLGDLGRYRMAIEDDDIRDREIWTAVSRYWYSKASDKSPTTGRLYHHLAILARPNALQQVYYYTKSLCVPTPFPSARESVMTLFDPVLSSQTPPRLEAIDAAFVRIHAIFFSGKSKDQLEPALDQFYALLDGHIAKTTKGWLESGYFISISIACSLLEYGDEANVLKRAVSPKRDESAPTEPGAEPKPSETFEQILGFAVRTYEIVTRRWDDTNILPYLHTTLVFLHHLSRFPGAMAPLEASFPWTLTATMLNELLRSCRGEVRMESETFPGAPKNELPRPLPEDYALRGLVYAEGYFPDDWFGGGKAGAVDDEEKYFELASMTDERRERILWLGRRIASAGRWLWWEESRGFCAKGEHGKTREEDHGRAADERDEQGDAMIPDAISETNMKMNCP